MAQMVEATLYRQDILTGWQLPNLLMILLRGRDLALNRTQNPHVLKYIPVFPCGLLPTDARSLQIISRF
jgi:hypothetical protein